MKKLSNSKFCYYFTFILLLCVGICKSQTQEELLEALKSEKETINYLANIENLSFKLKAGSKDFNPKDNSNFDKIKFDHTVSKVALDSFFKELRVGVSSIYPYNVFNIDKDQFDLIKFLGMDNFYFMNNPHLEASFVPTKINFLDGTSINADKYKISVETIQKKYGIEDEDGFVDVDEEKLSDIEKLIWNESNTFKYHFAINSSKPVASLDYQIEFVIPRSETYILSTANKVASTSFGEIKLLEIINATASLLIPSQLKKKFEIYAIYKDGRVMKQLSQNSNTVYSDEQKKGFADLLHVYELAETEVNRKSIQNIDQLKKFINTKSPFSDSNYFEPTNYNYKFDFAGPIDHLKIKVLNLEDQPELFKISATVRNDDKEFILSKDLNSDFYGILDVKGNWVVKPFLTEYVREMNKYFYRDQIDYGDTSDEKSYDRVYWFDHQNKTLKLVDYIPDSLELYDEKYCIVEKGINGKEGVVNGLTGEIVVPLIYYNVVYKDGKWVAKTEDYKETIYSLQGKKL
ncbi:hypothetical protein [Empedobacter sedimenti]|uniref:hypothetical protein n=1 Tax=Empedobacter sedimenti TaxID=3042610 RepID=UPI0024A77F9F|nr:hypothetical protein [Empedobacter sedimenti]